MNNDTVKCSVFPTLCLLLERHRIKITYRQHMKDMFSFRLALFGGPSGIKSISKNVFMKGSVFPVEVSWFKPSACFGLAKMFFSLVPERQTPADQSHYPTLFLCADPTRAERGLQTSLHWLPCTCAQQGLHGLCRRAFPTRCPMKTETSTNFWSCVTMM